MRVESYPSFHLFTVFILFIFASFQEQKCNAWGFSSHLVTMKVKSGNQCRKIDVLMGFGVLGTLYRDFLGSSCPEQELDRTNTKGSKFLQLLKVEQKYTLQGESRLPWKRQRSGQELNGGSVWWHALLRLTSRKPVWVLTRRAGHIILPWSQGQGFGNYFPAHSLDPPCW